MSDITPIGSHPRARQNLAEIVGNSAALAFMRTFGLSMDVESPILFRVQMRRSRKRPGWEVWAHQGSYSVNIGHYGAAPETKTRDDAIAWAKVWADRHGVPYTPMVMTQLLHGPLWKKQAPLEIGQLWYRWREVWSNEHHRYMAEVQQVATIEAIDGADVVVRYESGRKGRLCVTKFGRSGPWRIAPPGARRGVFELKTKRPEIGPTLRLVP